MDNRYLNALKAARGKTDLVAAKINVARDLAPGAGPERALNDMAGGITVVLDQLIAGEERRLAQMEEIAAADQAR
jgi:hypothetical protein